MECVTLIDFSSEDDFLIPSSSQGLEPEAFSNLEAENTERVGKQMEQLSEFSESPQQKRRRSDRYSLRKSLAWDSEFFTSEGVLNAEELAIINSTYSKAIGLKLPGIHEELRKSAESTSTLDSENKALENLETHLFENLRASSKSSLVASNQTANMEHSGKAKEPRKPDKPHLRNMKKLDISSQTKVSSGNGQSRTLNKPPKILSTTSSRAVYGKSSPSVVNKQIKSNRGVVSPGITAKRQAGGAPLNKANNDPGMVSRSIPSMESTLRTPQSSFKMVTTSSSSSSRPASSSSDSSSSRFVITRNSRINPIHSSSSFSTKTPLKTLRSRAGSTNQIFNSSSGMSTSLLSKVSPSSSIDSFISESSSQASTSTKHSNKFKFSNGRLSPSPSLPVSFENDASHKSGGAMSQSLTGNHSRITLKFDSDTRGTASLGLRMPRPRIGYFDKEKTLLHSSTNSPQTNLSSSLAKNNWIGDTSTANKSKLRSGAHSFSLNQTSKSSGYKAVSLKVKKESSPEGICKRNSKNKTEPPNPLQPKYFSTENQINGSGEERFNNLVISEEKENLCPESKTECQSRALRTEEQYSTTVTMLEGLVSSLSISEERRNYYVRSSNHIRIPIRRRHVTLYKRESFSLIQRLLYWTRDAS